MATEITTSAQRITSATTITCRHFLGASVATGGGTLTVDRGAAVAAGKRLALVEAGKDLILQYPAPTDDEDAGLAQRSRIHCAGATDAIIYFSV